MIQWFEHACIHSIPIVSGLISFFAWYVLVGSKFGLGSTIANRVNRSLKLLSDQPYLAFKISMSSTKHSNDQLSQNPFPLGTNVLPLPSAPSPSYLAVSIVIFVLRCRAPNLGSSVHHVSVPRSVADTHNSNKIDIKNHTLLLMGKQITWFGFT